MIFPTCLQPNREKQSNRNSVRFFFVQLVEFLSLGIFLSFFYGIRDFHTGRSWHEFLSCRDRFQRSPSGELCLLCCLKIYGGCWNISGGMETDTDISTKEDCIAWLSSIGSSINGTKEELEQRIARFRRFPGLVKKLRSRAEKADSFPTSLDPKAIPQSTAHWKTEEGTFPKEDERIFTNYASKKREGSIGQQQQATQMLSSRKIVSAKTFHDPKGSDVFVRAMMKKSYGEMKRPAVVLFQHGLPREGHCLCPVGLSLLSRSGNPGFSKKLQ